MPEYEPRRERDETGRERHDHAGAGVRLARSGRALDREHSLVQPPGEPHRDPGMGIRFQSLKPADREKIVEAVRTIAYVRQAEKN